MSAIDNMQEAIQRSESELHAAKSVLTDRLEPARRGQEESGQPEGDNDPMTGFQAAKPAE